MAVLFIETDSPPPFYQSQLSDARRRQLDQWFIGHRSQAYYLKRFEQFDKQGYLSAKWNWAGFAMTLPWLLYRKRYMDAIVYSVAGWTFIQVTIVLSLLFFEFLLMDFVPVDIQMMVRIGISTTIWLFWSGVVAMWSDAYFYRTARREVADAIDMHPRNEQAQKAHLQQEGGISLVSMGLAVGFFSFIIFLVNTNFLPLIAKNKEQAVIVTVYNLAKNAQTRVSGIYQQTGKCPVNLPVRLEEYQITLAVSTTAPAVETDCAVVATVHSVPFPNRYLNGQTLVLYHNNSHQETLHKENLQDSYEKPHKGNYKDNYKEKHQDSPQKKNGWECSTSLNKKQKPKDCVQ